MRNYFNWYVKHSLSYSYIYSVPFGPKMREKLPSTGVGHDFNANCAPVTIHMDNNVFPTQLTIKLNTI